MKLTVWTLLTDSEDGTNPEVAVFATEAEARAERQSFLESNWTSGEGFPEDQDEMFGMMCGDIDGPPGLRPDLYLRASIEEHGVEVQP